MTSRIESSPASSMQSRSQPNAMPPCGGGPYLNASSRKPNCVLGLLAGQPDARRTPAAASSAGGYGSSRRRSRCRCRRCRRRRPARRRARRSNLSAHSGSGEVNGWCTAVQPPVAGPPRTSARRPPRERPGCGVDQAAAAADLEPGRAEQLPGLARGRRRRRRCSHPAAAPVAVGQPGPLGLGQVLGHRAARQLAVRADHHVGQAAGARGPWPSPARRPARGGSARRRRA